MHGAKLINRTIITLGGIIYNCYYNILSVHLFTYAFMRSAYHVLLICYNHFHWHCHYYLSA